MAVNTAAKRKNHLPYISKIKFDLFFGTRIILSTKKSGMFLTTTEIIMDMKDLYTLMKTENKT